uniref:Ribulose-1,5-bisphosphate carboxylase/oxygenase large subunit n=1 Tax=Romanomermis culicivorax TaxID=13658 RepID=A0A915HP42_ROMCU
MEMLIFHLKDRERQEKMRGWHPEGAQGTTCKTTMLNLTKNDRNSLRYGVQHAAYCKNHEFYDI